MTAATSILTVMAHPDDAELWAGGTLARHVASGGTATIAVPRRSPLRDAEASAGARRLGVCLHQLDSPTTDAIVELLRDTRPDVVITHPAEDIHPQHRAIAEALAHALPDAVIATGRPHRAYTCDGYNNLDRHGRPLHLPTIIDVTTTWATKIAALREHASQPIPDHFEPMAHTLARLHGLRTGARYAEAFRVVPLLGLLPVCPDL